jgi:hypothetical protein
VVSEELKAGFRCRFFVALMYFWVREKKLWTFAITCRKTTFNSYETTPDPSNGGEYSPPKEASPYLHHSEGREEFASEGGVFLFPSFGGARGGLGGVNGGFAV